MFCKKVGSVLLAAVLLLSLAGCGDDAPKGSDLKQPESEPAQAAPLPEKEPEEEAAEPIAAPQEPTAVTVDQQVLVDESGVKITATGMEEDSLFGPSLRVLIENNTETDLTVQTRGASVNGYMIEALFSTDVAAGKKANDTITFMDSDLEGCGIETIADIECAFHIFASEGWDTYLDTAPVIVKTSAADGFSYTYDDTGETLYTGNNLRIIAKGLSDEDSFFGPGLVLFLENTGSQSVTVQARDVSINGFMIDGLLSEEVAAGKRAIASLTFMSTDLQNNQITQITDAELSFHVFKTDGWDTIVDTEKVSLQF